MWESSIRGLKLISKGPCIFFGSLVKKINSARAAFCLMCQTAGGETIWIKSRAASLLCLKTIQFNFMVCLFFFQTIPFIRLFEFWIIKFGLIFKIITTLQVFAVLLFLFIVVKDNRIPKRIDTTSTKVERSDNKFSLYSVSRNHYSKTISGSPETKKEVDFVPFFLDIKLFIEFLVVPDTSTQEERLGVL